MKTSTPSNSKTLVVLDIDGTLVDENYRNNDATLPSFIKEAQPSGITFCINSNRSLEDLLPIAQQFNIEGLLIGEDGAFVYEQLSDTTRLLMSSAHEQDASSRKQKFEKNLHARLEVLANAPVHWLTIDTIRAIVKHEDVSYDEGSVVVLNNQFRRYTTSAHIKRVCGHELVSDATLAAQLVQSLGDASIQHSPLFANILVSYVDTSKTKALQQVVAGYDRVYVIGDEIGDSRMAQNIATFMTTNNAEDSIKQLAKKVSKGSHAAGVHELLRSIVLH